MVRTVPVVLVAGHLGVGKSSLVNHLLRRAAGTRIGVVVNDFGAVGIDAMLVAGQASAVSSLANGCLCCVTDADGLTALLADLTAPAAGLDLVVVEASGLAEPRELVRLLLATTDEHVAYGGLVVVVDAAAPRLDQAALADLVVVNKIGAVPDPDAVLDRVRAVAGGAVLATDHGALDPSLLVEPPVRPRSAQLSFDDLVRDDAAAHEHPHAGHDTVSFTSDRPLDPVRLAAFLEAGPRGVFRAKGIVRFPGARPFVVQTVGTAIRVEPAPRHLDEEGAAIVLIGVGLDAPALTAALEGCVADADPGEHALLAMLRYAP